MEVSGQNSILWTRDLTQILVIVENDCFIFLSSYLCPLSIWILWHRMGRHITVEENLINEI